LPPDILSGRPTTKRGINEWNSYVCFPKTKSATNCIYVENYLPNHIKFNGDDLVKIARKKRESNFIWKNFPKIINLDYDFVRLLGLFCAEGSTAKSTRNGGDPSGVIVFSFNYSELDTYVDEVVRTITRIFPSVKPIVFSRPERNLCEVLVRCVPLAYLFRSLCGIGSKNKFVPEVIFESFDEIKEEFLSGLFDGDAKNPENDVNQQATLRTSSIDLAYGVKRLLADLSEWVNVVRCEEQNKICYNVPYSPRRSYSRFISDSSYVYKPIREIKYSYEEVDVYNFEVEEDNSYVSDFVLHNCEMYVNQLQPESKTRADTAAFRINLSPEEDAKFGKNNHLLALAYNDVGYSNLVYLTSWAWKHGFYKKPRVNHKVLYERREGIIFTSTCANSEIANAFFAGGDEAGFAMLEKYLAMFGENFYLELMMLDFKLQKPYDAFLLKAHAKYNTPLILTQDCHYCKKEHSRYQRLMLMQQTKRTIKELEALAASGESDLFELQDQNLWMKSEEELNLKWESDYSQIIDYELYKQAKANTVRICEKAANVKIDRSIKLPSLADEDLVLWEEIQKGKIKRRIPNTDEYEKRIKEEYELIKEKGFSSYFLIQKMMIDEARNKSPEILGFGDGSEAVGPGRGSFCGSLVAYCLKLHDVEPVKHNLLFSRFLSPTRGGKQMKTRFTIDPLGEEDE
jgi:hypothetical protein